MGSKQAKSGTKAVPRERGSAAYGSEIEYKQVGVGVVVSSQNESEEELEESFEEEMEEELSEERNRPLPDDQREEDQISRRTSFSSFYVIDEQEEARLKAIAFERFIKEQ